MHCNLVLLFSCVFLVSCQLAYDPRHFILDCPELLEQPVAYEASQTYSEYYSLPTDRQHQMFSEFSPLDQFMVMRDALLSKNANASHCMDWFAENDDETIQKICSFMMLNDFDNANFYVVYSFLYAKDMIDKLYEERFIYLGMTFLVKQRMLPYVRNEHVQIGKTLRNRLFLRDQDYMEKKFRHVLRRYAKPDEAEAYVMHQQAFAELLNGFYGVKVDFPKGLGLD